jgi:hypothetical protein
MRSKHRVDWPLWRKWTKWVTLGELAGFTVPALVGVLASAAGAPSGLLYAAMLPAGAFEGACLGYAETRALRGHLPQIPAGQFTAATAAAAVLAYGLGMLPSTLGEGLDDVPDLLLFSAVGAGALVLLLSIGTAQALVLRQSGLDAWWWIAATAGAWLAALAVFLLVATPLWQPGQPLAITIVVAILAGCLMAATVAVLTGFSAVRLVDQRGHATGPSSSDAARSEAR